MKALLLFLSLIGLCLPHLGAEVPQPPPVKLPAGLTDSFVHVEITPRTAEGQEPHTLGWARRCPNCGRFHGDEAAEALKEKRSLSWMGVLVSENEVIVTDPVLASAHIEAWHVSKGDQLVEAKLDAVSPSIGAIRLKLDKPLAGAKPVAAFKSKGEPAIALTCSEESATWKFIVQPLGGGMLIAEDGSWQLPCPSSSLVLDRDNQVIGYSIGEGLDSVGSWRRHPASWDWLGAEDYARLMDGLSARVLKCIGSARLHLRPLPIRKGRNGMDMEEQREDPSQQPLPALVLASRRVMVLADLPPRTTARLESVDLELEGRIVSAKFLASSSQYGVLLVEPQTALAESLVLSRKPWGEQLGSLLPSARLRFGQGRSSVHFDHLRISTLKRGYLGMLAPELSTSDDAPFVFDRDGSLVGLPVASRSHAARNRWESSSTRFYLHASALVPYLGELATLSDSNNVPVSAEASRRKPWLGLRLQPMDEELARASGTLELMRKGEQGALVTHVYPDSPAARMKLEVGDVVMRIHPAGAPLPLKIELENLPFDDGSFPWDKYDQLPEQYYDQIPEPWLKPDGRIVEALKDLGFGKQCTLEYYRAGHLVSANFTVEAGPVDYESTVQETYPELGLGLRELTYDTRTYFQLDDSASGLIASSVEPGGLASVAGIKPYEVLVSLNEQPLRTQADLKALLAAQKHLTFVVRRMHQTRIVVIDLKK